MTYGQNQSAFIWMQRVLCTNLTHLTKPERQGQELGGKRMRNFSKDVLLRAVRWVMVGALFILWLPSLIGEG